ncbi:hypothetical protein [Geothrix campi]|uniref:hypothetical protein n=1 Tax=Geothrix campi TaxID=2966450 RepID=UPI0021480FC6|nr:hypothetical protein [Geothrix sp. SG10]
MRSLFSRNAQERLPKRAVPATPATPATPGISATPATAAAPVATSPQEIRTMALDNIGEKDTQPLFFRLTQAANAAQAGNSKVPLFNVTRTTNPDKTNLEVANGMPNTSRFIVSGVEIRVNPNTTAAALAMFIAHTRLVLNVGAKGYEKLNQPTILFPGLGGVRNITGLDFSTSDVRGLHTFNPGEEVKLQESQTFDMRFEVDATGYTLGAADVLDVVVILKGQKQSQVAL